MKNLWPKPYESDKNPSNMAFFFGKPKKHPLRFIQARENPSIGGSNRGFLGKVLFFYREFKAKKKTSRCGFGDPKPTFLDVFVW